MYTPFLARPAKITKSSLWKTPDEFRSYTLRTWENREQTEREASFTFI